MRRAAEGAACYAGPQSDGGQIPRQHWDMGAHGGMVGLQCAGWRRLVAELEQVLPVVGFELLELPHHVEHL